MSKRLVVETLVVFACIFLLSVATALAPCYPPNNNTNCEGNFDYDCDVDGTDAALFKTDFGRSGFKNPCPPAGPALVPKTGQTTAQRSCDDGDLSIGIAWPNPRFTDNGLTVTDNLTGLEWIKNRGMFSTPMTWEEAMEACLTMVYDGTGWRLPNVMELLSLIDWEYENPAIPNTAGTGQWTEGNPFVGLGPIAPNCWTSTNVAGWPGQVWVVATYGGYVDPVVKTETMYVWPVRGGTPGQTICTPITTTSILSSTTSTVTTVFPAPVPKTGRTVSFRTGDDGDLEKGVSWPNPRFTDNGNGTVTDNLTGLIWMKNANCFGVRNWEGALSDCNTLHAPHPYCALDDGSNAGDWRLPTRFELESLLDLDYRCITSTPPFTSTTTTIKPPSHVPIPNTAGDGPWSEGDPFTNVQPYWYWSSTSYAEESDPFSILAWMVEFSRGQVNYTSSGVSNYVWCVRGGQ